MHLDFIDFSDIICGNFIQIESEQKNNELEKFTFNIQANYLWDHIQPGGRYLNEETPSLMLLIQFQKSFVY